MELNLEVIGIPVSDVDTAKAFHVEQVGFGLDHDVRPAEGMRVVQMIGESNSSGRRARPARASPSLPIRTATAERCRRSSAADGPAPAPSGGTRSAAIQTHADEAQHRRERVVVPIEMEDAEATLGRGRGDQIVRGGKSPTPAQLPRGAQRSGAHRRSDRGLRQRGSARSSVWKAILVARAHQDLQRRHREAPGP